MKVLMINVVCGIRSTGRICTDIATSLSKQGHDVKIAYGREQVPEQYQKYAIRIGSDFDVVLHGIKSRFFDAAGFGSKRETERFLRWAEEYNPDLLLLHNLHGYYINVESLFEWIKGRPQMQIKWTLHDCWAFTGHCSHFFSVNCLRWKSQCEKCPQKMAYPSSFLFDFSKRNYERKKVAFSGVKNLTLITPSIWLSELVKKSILAEYPVEVSYNNIDRTVFKPTCSDFRKKYNLENRIIILGVASAWSEKKGLYDFYKLSKMLDEKYAIVLVGLNKMQLRRLPSGIIGISKTNNVQELAKIYTAADVFFNPTYEDTYPTVNLEAEACGTPVVTYATGGAPETLSRTDSTVIPVGNYQFFLEQNR